MYELAAGIIIIQIIAESLPISSSGHVALFQALAGKVGSETLIDALDTLAHIPNIIIILIFFAQAWWPLVQKFFCSASRWWRGTLRFSDRRLFAVCMRIFFNTVAATCVTVFLYGIIRVKADAWIMTREMFFLPLGLCATCAVLLVSRKAERTSGSLGVREALLLGFVQGLALLPGVSRLATTFVAARFLHIPPRRAFEVSFLIALPLFVAATFKESFEMIANGTYVYLMSPGLIAVAIIASLISWFALCFSYSMAQRGLFYRFGWYMLVPLAVACGVLVSGA